MNTKYAPQILGTNISRYKKSSSFFTLSKFVVNRGAYIIS